MKIRTLSEYINIGCFLSALYRRYRLGLASEHATASLELSHRAQDRRSWLSSFILRMNFNPLSVLAKIDAHRPGLWAVARSSGLYLRYNTLKGLS